MLSSAWCLSSSCSHCCNNCASFHWLPLSAKKFLERKLFVIGVHLIRSLIFGQYLSTTLSRVCINMYSTMQQKWSLFCIIIIPLFGPVQFLIDLTKHRLPSSTFNLLGYKIALLMLVVLADCCCYLRSIVGLDESSELTLCGGEQPFLLTVQSTFSLGTKFLMILIFF
mgnify:CR=1 FL=1